MLQVSPGWNLTASRGDASESVTIQNIIAADRQEWLEKAGGRSSREFAVARPFAGLE